MKKIFCSFLICAVACGQKSGNTSLEQADHKFMLENLLLYDSEDELISSFGSGNISRDTIDFINEDGDHSYEVTVLYPKTSNEVEFAWWNHESHSELEYIRIRRETSKWSSKGVTIGTPTLELIKLHRKDFEFYGFGRQNGSIISWNNDGGKLAELYVTIQPNMTNLNPAERDRLFTDSMLSTKDDIVRKNNPIVTEIMLVKH